MVDLEKTQEFRQKALELLPQTYNPNMGIYASADKRYRVFFTRDSCTSILQASAHEYNFSIPGFLDHAILSLNTVNQYRGIKYDPETGEEPGRPPHEVHTEEANQSRLEQIAEWGLPVKRNEQTGKLYMINYFTGDAASMAIETVKAVLGMVDKVQSTKSGNTFLEKMWPGVLAGLEHNQQNVDSFGQGVIVTDPKAHYPFQTWRDGRGAYRTEEGNMPEFPPLIFLSNVCHYVRSLYDSSEMADKLGEAKTAADLKIKADQARDKMDQLFWSDKLGFYIPLIDKNGPVEMVNNDAIDAIFCGVVSEKRANAVIDRMFEDDMFTNYGVRTRSTNSNQFIDSGWRAYQNGAIWPQRNTMLALGALRYGRKDAAKKLLETTNNYVEEAGFGELRLCTREGELKPHLEDGKDTAPKIQSWALYGYLGLSAVALSGQLEAI